jgi:Trm5-related predicted tRNA methylase
MAKLEICNLQLVITYNYMRKIIKDLGMNISKMTPMYKKYIFFGFLKKYFKSKLKLNYDNFFF